MNRANDEFLFLDTGSHTCRIESKEEHDSTTTTTLTNVPLPSVAKKRRRVLVKSTTTDDAQAWLLRLNSATFAPDETDVLPSLIDLNGGATSNKTHAPTTIHWTRHTRCRMPSASMPWMAQRLTWEQYDYQQEEPTSSSDDPTTSNNEEPINEDESKPWSGEIALSIGSMDDTTMSILPENVFVQQSASSSHVSYVMIQCLTTQQVLCVARQYEDDHDNKLCSVVWSEGKAVCVVDNESRT